MKKFIATAALVAASTALASAATVVFTTASSVSGATETVALVQKSTGAGKQTLTFTSSTTFSGASTALSLDYEISTARDWNTEVSSSTNTNTALSDAFNEATGLSLSDYAGKNFYGAGNGNKATLTFTGLKASTEYRFSFVGAGRSGGSIALSITTGSLSDTERGGGSFYGSMSGSDTTTITNTATLADAGSTSPYSNASTAATFVVTSDANGKVVFSADGNKPAFVAIAVSDVIPEPSAFGLLAGIGALALAVSRRKRSRR